MEGGGSGSGCLEVVRRVGSGSVSLIALDPVWQQKSNWGDGRGRGVVVDSTASLSFSALVRALDSVNRSAAERLSLTARTRIRAPQIDPEVRHISVHSESH